MSKTSRYFETLAVEVAGGATIRQAADTAGCAESTAYRVCRTPEFRKSVSAKRTEATDAAVGRLSKLVVDAVEVLREIMQDVNQPPAARVSASKTVIASLAPLSELHEFRQRLDRIESQQQLKVVG